MFHYFRAIVQKSRSLSPLNNCRLFSSYDISRLSCAMRGILDFETLNGFRVLVFVKVALYRRGSLELCSQLMVALFSGNGTIYFL
jgi:hypothetical protein